MSDKTEIPQIQMSTEGEVVRDLMADIGHHDPSKHPKGWTLPNRT